MLSIDVHGNDRFTRMADEKDLIKAGTEGVAAAVMQPFRELLVQFLGPVTNELGTGLRYIAYPWRLKKGLRAMQKARRLLAEAGIEPHAVPPKLFLPILENASLEEDESLQERWAALLANAASPGGSRIRRAFPEILKQLSPSDAAFLDDLFQYVCHQIGEQNLPGTALSALSIELEEWLPKEMSPEFAVMLGNLERLQILA